jgi:hypothetical protein
VLSGPRRSGRTTFVRSLARHAPAVLWFRGGRVSWRDSRLDGTAPLVVVDDADRMSARMKLRLNSSRLKKIFVVEGPDILYMS